MTPNEELDLARAKVLATQIKPEMRWDDYAPVEQQGWILIARAIRLGDEARGLRVVPVEATIDMVVNGTEKWLCVAAMEDRAEVIWNAMLAASPFAPEEKG